MQRSPPRKRNKVAALAALHSPPPQSIPEAENANDEGSVSSNSTSSSASSQRKKLPDHLQAQLAEDIEASGGIERFLPDSKQSNKKRKRLKPEEKTEDSQKLRKLLDKNKALYKESGDPVRRRIQLKVLRWQRYFQEGTYADKVLTKYQIVPYRFRDPKEEPIKEATVPLEISFESPPTEVSISSPIMPTYSSSRLASGSAQAPAQSSGAGRASGTSGKYFALCASFGLSIFLVS